MKEIYFDNSATTSLCNEAAQKMRSLIEDLLYGNPSSKHAKGLEASKLVNFARAQVLGALGVRGISDFKENRLVFTASGTEADNLAILGACAAKKFVSGKNIIISDSEHPAVSECAGKLERDGYVVVRIPTLGGVLDYDMLEKSVNDKTALVSIMLVNNETGAVNDIKKISRIVKGKNPETLVHTDAVQGFLKVPMNFISDVDLVSISSHKVHGPKGVGALYVDPDVFKKRKLSPIIFGGGQENGFRSGTENTIGIVGFGAAAEAGHKALAADVAYIRGLRDHICNVIANDPSFAKFKLNIPKAGYAPHIISLQTPGIKSETVLNFLSSKGIFVSSGSACASNSLKRISSTLINFGLCEKEADSTVRISLSKFNTKDECDALLNALAHGEQTLISMA